jgi:hypothetical protein
MVAWVDQRKLKLLTTIICAVALSFVVFSVAANKAEAYTDYGYCGKKFDFHQGSFGLDHVTDFVRHYYYRKPNGQLIRGNVYEHSGGLKRPYTYRNVNCERAIPG